MDKCCSCCVDKSKDRAAGHVFDCRHFLCENCLGTFGKASLRSVCFTCGSPPPVDNPPQSPFDKMTEKSGKEKANNLGSIVDDCPTKSSIPSEFIYDRVDLELTNISLSGNGSGGNTEAAGQTTRMEGRAKSSRRTSPGENNYRFVDFARTLREKMDELEAAEKVFKDQGTLVQNQIKRHAQMCHALIDRDERRLLEQLNDMMNATLSENSAAISNIQSLIQRLEKADERDVEEMDEVEQLLTSRIGITQFKDVDVHLHDSICPPEDKNILGELKIEPIPDHSSFLSTPVLIGSIAGRRDQAVTGVTALDREIFVARDSSQDISVYAVISNTFLRSLSLLNLLEPIVIPIPVDLAAYKTTRSLYVADEGNKYVFHLRPDGKLVHWWPVENLRGLSVTTTGTVLVGSGRAIKEYDPSGKLVRTIQNNPLGLLFRGKERPSMRHPTHFLEKDNGRIVVCDFVDARNQHVVYDLDRRGCACACWHGNRADSGDEFLNEPRHLAIDVTGHVMVVDRLNDRVKLLDAELKFVRDLMGVGQFFKRPQRLHYDPARGLLYVGLVAGDTLVFRVTI